LKKITENKIFFEIKVKMKRNFEKNPKNRNYKMLILHNFYEKTVKSKKCKFKAKKYERIWINLGKIVKIFEKYSKITKENGFLQ